METFEQWRSKREVRPLPLSPAQTGYEEIQRGILRVLRKLREKYDVLQDTRLRRVVSGQHKNRVCLIVLDLATIAKGLRRVRFLDTTKIEKEATLHDLELSPFRS